MFVYLINQTNIGNKRTCILQRHSTAKNTLEGRHFHREKVYLTRGETLRSTVKACYKGAGP